MKAWKTLLCPSALALASGLTGQSALAQATSAQASANDPASKIDIIVTARKRDERLIDVPVAASTLSHEDLSRYAISSFSAIAQQTPQLIISDIPSQVGSVINLRGIGGSQSASGSDQPVTTVVDNVALSQSNVLRLGQFDLARVEVLKGPQSVFFGKNSPAGVVSLISNDPGKALEAQVRTGYEFKNKQRYVEGIVSGPLGGGFGARIVGYISDEDGWFRNVATSNPLFGIIASTPRTAPNETEKFGRLTLTYAAPDDRFNARFKVNYGKVDKKAGLTSSSQFFACSGPAPQFSISSSDCKPDRNYISANVGQQIVAAAGVDPLNNQPYFFDGKPFFRSAQTLSSLELDYKLSDAFSLTSVTGYYHLNQHSMDNLTPELSLAAFQTAVRNRQWSQELRLSTSFDGPLNIVAGGYFEDRKITERIIVAFGAGVFAPFPFVQPTGNLITQSNAYSGFIDATYAISPQIDFILGGRYTQERKKQGGYTFGGTFNLPSTDIIRPAQTYNDFSPEITLRYRPSTDLTLYASYREGFTSGGFNNLDAPYQQATVRGGEAGLKGYALDRQMRFDLTGYYYAYKGYQVSVFNPVTAQPQTTNAATVKTRGFEANAIMSPRAAPGLDLRMSVAYNRGTYGAYSTAGCYAGQTIALGCDHGPKDGGGGFTAQDLSGRPIHRAPKWTINPGLTYDRPLTGGLNGSISFDAAYQSSFFTQPEEDPRSVQSGYWTLNGALSVHGANRNWDLSLIGTNLTNKLAVVAAFSGIATGGGTGTNAGVLSDLNGALSAPRTILLQLTLHGWPL